MIRQPMRRFFSLLVVFTLTLGSTTAAADGEDPTITFFGGGFGHGIGMSQYGALGRAEAGHTYDDILGFYYPNTTIEKVSTLTPFDTEPASVNVLMDVRSSVAVSTPLSQSAPEYGWEVEVYAGDFLLGTSTRPVTGTWNGSRWTATWSENGSKVVNDLCAGVDECANSTLEIAFDPEGAHNA